MICLHPGHCQTDMGGKHAPITVEEGARRINVGIWLNEVDSSQFYNTKPCSWVSC